MPTMAQLATTRAVTLAVAFPVAVKLAIYVAVALAFYVAVTVSVSIAFPLAAALSFPIAFPIAFALACPLADATVAAILATRRPRAFLPKHRPRFVHTLVRPRKLRCCCAVGLPDASRFTISWCYSIRRAHPQHPRREHHRRCSDRDALCMFIVRVNGCEQSALLHVE